MQKPLIPHPDFMSHKSAACGLMEIEVHTTRLILAVS